MTDLREGVSETTQGILDMADAIMATVRLVVVMSGAEQSVADLLPGDARTMAAALRPISAAMPLPW